ncbi:unnamed protein product [Urochloa decumbens]|uniref:DUF295 domain-containing protein n=1 Tax=Urochloa decumbens TaxID=240449 RepID=A0ABC8XKA1_9POAL
MLRWKGKDFKEKRRHLYLVLDDWPLGYSIRKIDLVGNGDRKYRRAGNEVTWSDDTLLPPIFRFEAPRGRPEYFAGAFDSRILALQPMDSQFTHNPTAGAPMFDVRKRSLMPCPRQRPDPVDPIYIPVGGRLFALSAGSFQLLYPPPDANGGGLEDFVWTSLPTPPFQCEHVTSYGIHGDGRTIFVSTGMSKVLNHMGGSDKVSTGGSPSIFSFDTAESVRSDCMWKQHGQWQLPFNGRGHFVAELGAWVGLVEHRKVLGSIIWRICSIDVTSDNWDHDHDAKFCEVQTLSDNVDNFVFVVGAALVSMGGSKFCLVQCCSEGVGPPYLQLSTFNVMYDRNGDLTTGNNRCLAYYNFAEGVTMKMLQNPVAFWM